MSEHTAHHHNHGAFAELRILLVHTTREPELTRSLARAGHDVLTVDDAGRAVRLLTVFRPDAVLVHADDAAIVQQLRRHDPEVTLVAVTPDDVPAQRVAALNAGADDCVSEPFHDAELRARIRMAVRRSSTRVTP
jgi:two-component system, OmpR family, response regulator